MDNDVLNALRELTFYNVYRGTDSEWYAHICRWYSKTFFTPLKQVMEMPDEEVYRVYFSDTFYILKHSDSEPAKKEWQSLCEQYGIATDVVDKDQQEKEDDEFIKKSIEEFERREAIKKGEAEKPKRKPMVSGSTKIEQNVNSKSAIKSNDNDDLPNLQQEDSYTLVGESLDQIPSDN